MSNGSGKTGECGDRSMGRSLGFESPVVLSHCDLVFSVFVTRNTVSLKLLDVCVGVVNGGLLNVVVEGVGLVLETVDSVDEHLCIGLVQRGRVFLQLCSVESPVSVNADIECGLVLNWVVACGLPVVEKFPCDVLVNAACEESCRLGGNLSVYGLFEGVHTDGRESFEDVSLR